MNAPLKQNAEPAPAYVPAVFTDDEFEALIGELSRIGRFELREGMIYRMNSQHLPHARAKVLLFKGIESSIQASGQALEAVIEVTVGFGGGFMPEPDIVLWRPQEGVRTVPGERVVLVVEVSDFTLADDLGVKRDLYAKAGLPEYWVADLNARVIHLFAEPKDGAFTRAAQIAFGDRAVSLTNPALAADTAALARL